MRTDVAENFGHLQELLFEGAWKKELGRFRSPWAFRGLSDARYPLDTTLQRLGGQFRQLEHHLLRNFMKYAHRDLVEPASCWHWLSVAQHHGLPTRLLDWTYSPLVAMHFATTNIAHFDRDGAVWCINYEGAHDCLPKKLKKLLGSEGANSFTTEMLAGAAASLAQFDAISDAHLLLFFEPPSLDDRIVNQFALFSVASSADFVFADWFARFPQLCRQVVIPAGIKWEIRDKLDQCNMTERVLFPGLDGLSRWLKRHYGPKREQAAPEYSR